MFLAGSSATFAAGARPGVPRAPAPFFLNN